MAKSGTVVLSIVSLSFSYYYFDTQGVTMINNKVKGPLKEIIALNYPDLKSYNMRLRITF